MGTESTTIFRGNEEEGDRGTITRKQWILEKSTRPVLNLPVRRERKQKQTMFLLTKPQNTASGGGGEAEGEASDAAEEADDG